MILNPELDSPVMTRIGGIPFEWWHQVDLACESYLRCKGIQFASRREQIKRAAMLGAVQKAAQHRQSGSDRSK